jgi:hypothetical protein
MAWHITARQKGNASGGFFPLFVSGSLLGWNVANILLYFFDHFVSSVQGSSCTAIVFLLLLVTRFFLQKNTRGWS